MDQDLRVRVARQHLIEFGDVVVVVVREQHVRELEWPAREELQQRLHRSARVDHDRVATKLVSHRIGVGQPLIVHRALDDHAWEPTGRLRACP